MTNRLANETSPYLLQHADNPVEWHPWGDEAIGRARREDRPILLSIGYSACHWCHVMAHESFEDPEVAEIMNRLFVNVKVDREERPDLDEIYMTATQLQTGHGGWPMTVFLTPELRPFLCGTYFPREPRYGMPSFPQLLEHVANLWETRRDAVDEQAEALVQAVAKTSSLPAATGEADERTLDGAYETYARSADRHRGGFGGAPKFPQPMAHLFLLRYWRRTGNEDAREIVTTTLQNMAEGGIYDHLGGGFARYSVDERWVVPHFEKMLYDNALLARLYLEAFQATGREDFRRVAAETLDYVRRDLGSPGGGFCSAEDADSEGEEGKFYVWRPEEVEEVVGDPEAARIVSRYYGVSPEGNFEHATTILTRTLPLETCGKLFAREPAEVARIVEEARGKLFEVRSRRVRPGRDDKVLAGWTGLAAHAFALGWTVLGRAEDRASAERALRFVLDEMRRDGKLQRTWKDGQARIDAFQEDYAFLLDALVALYEATFDPEWIERAIPLADRMIELFHDEAAGGFFFTEADRPDVLVRGKSPYENAIPSGNASAAMALARLARLTGRDEYARKAEGTFRAFQAGMDRSPSGFPYLIAALELSLTPPREVVLVGPDEASLAPFREVLAKRFEPDWIVAGRAGAGGRSDLVPLLDSREPVAGRAAAYVCRDFTCQPPTTDPKSLERALK